MLVYWTMYVVPAFSAMIASTRAPGTRVASSVPLYFVALAYVLLIGLRFEIGPDWFTYENIVGNISLEDLGTSMSYGDPAFSFFAWVSTRIGAETYGANLVCGLILVIGVVQFCRKQDDVWLAISAAVPYLIIVVGMGYVRQSAAIGLLLLALVQFEKGAFVRSLGYLAVAALFHASVIVVAPIFALAVVRKHAALIVPAGLIAVILFVVLLQSRLDSFYVIYVEAEYDSSGAAVRLLMNAVPAIIFIIYRKSFPGAAWSRSLWFLFSIMSLALIAMLRVSPSTTLLDRVGLYFVPIQLYVFGNLSTAMRLRGGRRPFVNFASVLYYAVVLFVWLNFASHAELFLPYRFLPLER